MARKGMQDAKAAKRDEFYTLLPDIERELSHYTGCFKGQTVLCNCNDGSDSAFFRYFLKNFKSLGLRKLVGIEYRKGENGSILTCDNGWDITTVALEGDGDFRSEECMGIMEGCDIVVTNPPFSIFREYFSQLVSMGKKFLIIGNVNCITYKEVFAQIEADKAWLGVNMGRGISGFMVPDQYRMYGTECRIDDFGKRIVSTNSCLWLTNLDHPSRHGELSLEKAYYGHEDEYPRYDNHDGINVDRTRDIPKDWDGDMGVPITFLHKYNPEQFQIVRFRKGDDGKDLSIGGRCPYFRILIRRRK